MHAHNAAAAYATVTKSVLEPKSVEYKAILRINGRLNAANDTPGTSFSELADAVHQNNKLWTILAADVASEGNELPKSLRAQILSLAIFIQKTSRAVLRGEGGLDEIIEINTAIMRGLSGDPGTASKLEGVA